MILLLIWALMRFWDMSVVHNKKQQRQQITTNRECDTLQEENFCCGCCDNIDEVNSGCNECNCHNRKGSDDNYLSHYFKGKRFASSIDLKKREREILFSTSLLLSFLWGYAQVQLGGHLTNQCTVTVTCD